MTPALTRKSPSDFWDRIAQKYAKRPIADLTAYEAKLADLAERLKPSDHVLEIGCGTGGTALRLAGGVASYTATDISARMIDIAKSKSVEDASCRPLFLQADAKATLEDATFDVVCAFSLLHLVDDIEGVIGAVRSQLKPGGLFISKTVCLKAAPFPVRLFVRALTAIGYAPFVASLGHNDLVEQLRSAGFEIEDIRFFGKNRLNPYIVARKS